MFSWVQLFGMQRRPVFPFGFYVADFHYCFPLGSHAIQVVRPRPIFPRGWSATLWIGVRSPRYLASQNATEHLQCFLFGNVARRVACFEQEGRNPAMVDAISVRVPQPATRSLRFQPQRARRATQGATKNAKAPFFYASEF